MLFRSVIFFTGDKFGFEEFHALEADEIEEAGACIYIGIHRLFGFANVRRRGIGPLRHHSLAFLTGVNFQADDRI